MKKTNTLAILSLILSFIFPPLGLIFGIVAINQIKKKKEWGRELAVAGIVLSIILLATALIIFLTVASISMLSYNY